MKVITLMIEKKIGTARIGSDKKIVYRDTETGDPAARIFNKSTRGMRYA